MEALQGAPQAWEALEEADAATLADQEQGIAGGQPQAALAVAVASQGEH